ncbi:AAA family ATPase [Pseudomonas sp.]|uniref:AAA family ATPase n=1 Tax=Pseudomonas sp. TaxID=306 RepID=UPI00272D3720|nr:AAA family ATPase [Pseudomonas sp.]
MPFANERLAANKEQLAQRATRTGLRQTRFTFDPGEVMQRLRARILGQDDALAAIEDMLQVVRADIGPEQRPLGVCLLMGPTGVGKTETVRVLAEAIHGSADALCRIDMNTLSQEHYASALTGAPPGYVGSKEGHTLFDADKIRGSFSKPGIVLFDELEKASTEVIRTLLNVLDAGLLTLPAGNRTIDFRNSLIFLTSNLGAAELARYQGRFRRGWRRLLRPSAAQQSAILEQALSRRFDPEFINRIDHVLHFQPLPAAEADALLEIELSRLRSRLQKQSAAIQLTLDARRWLCRNYDPRYGARDLSRRVRQHLAPAVAQALLAHADVDHFLVRFGDQRLEVLPDPAYVK